MKEVAAQCDPESIDDWFAADEVTLQDEDNTLQDESLREKTNFSPPNLRDRATIKAPDHLTYAMLTEIQEPINYQKAIKSTETQKWKEAMKEEMEPLEENLTWSLVKLPKGRRTISN